GLAALSRRARGFGRDDRRGFRLADDRLALDRRVALALLPLAFHLLRLLRDLLDREADGGLPRPGVAVAVQEFLSARVQRDVGAMPVLLAAQYGLRRHSAVVEQAFQFSEFSFEESSKRRSDFDVTSSEFEAH